MNIGKRRRTVYIEPIEEPANPPVEEPAPGKEPAAPDPVRETELEPVARAWS